MTSPASSNRPVIAVTGGAGYLGRCMMELLWDTGYAPLSLDNYSTGHRFHSDKIPAHEIDLTDAEASRALWKTLPRVSGIIHFAALALVEESNRKPGAYFRNNILSAVNIAELAVQDGIPVIHSSSCAVYGVPENVPIEETSPMRPITPYGETKRAAEALFSQFAKAQGLRGVNLRYFNPGGALTGGSHGEAHTPETHLIPNVVRLALGGQAVTVYGTNHPTADGSAVRDFIHVEDLCRGHIHALQWLTTQPKGSCDSFNLGSGKGTSVLEVVRAAENTLEKKIEIQKQPPRQGDPPALVANISKAKAVLGWSPKLGLTEILRSHAEWERRRP